MINTCRTVVKLMTVNKKSRNGKTDFLVDSFLLITVQLQRFSPSHSVFFQARATKRIANCEWREVIRPTT